MIDAQILLRSILGPVRADINPFALAVDITGELLFTQQIPMDHFLISRYVYPDVARLMCKRTDTISRRIGRLAHLCWDILVEHDLVLSYLGRDLKEFPTPGCLIIYLAVYARFGSPFFSVIQQCPQLLFLSGEKIPYSPDSLTISKVLHRDQALRVSQIMKIPYFSDYTYFPVCPNCGITMEREYQSFCDRCGQRLDWKYFDRAQIVYPGSSERKLFPV